MIRMFCFIPVAFWLLVLAILSGCEEVQKPDTELSIQQNLFLQSILLVEKAGKKLQNPQLQQSDIDLAMSEMDEGLRQAFQVKDKFLKQVDARLPKFYTKVFIPGVEKYRIGVEASDKYQQLDGLNLLSQWGQYWLQLKPDIHRRLKAING